MPKAKAPLNSLTEPIPLPAPKQVKVVNFTHQIAPPISAVGVSTEEAPFKKLVKSIELSHSGVLITTLSPTTSVFVPLSSVSSLIFADELPSSPTAKEEN